MDKDQRTILMFAELEKIRLKKLAEANAKLEAIKEALPKGLGAKVFEEKVRRIIEGA
jgi:hypothetical protein